MEPKPNTIEGQASDWVTREDAGLTPAETLELEDWLAADERHRGAYVRVKAAWLDTERLASLAGGQLTPDPYESPSPRAPARWRTAPLLIAAGVVSLLVGAVTLWSIQYPRGQTYTSEIGEVRNIELSDGSELTLNTNTEARVWFQDQQREVTLDRGEALFKVAHDASRPFVVRANRVWVKAIGTAFTVRVDDSRTDVVVTEGTVEISHPSASSAPDVQRVSANHHVILDSASNPAGVEPVAPEALQRELAWRDGMAAFAGEPLGMAAAQINRHSRHPIVIDDPVLASRPIIGLFHANDAEAFATAAATTFHAEVVHIDGTIHLRPIPSR